VGQRPACSDRTPDVDVGNGQGLGKAITTTTSHERRRGQRETRRGEERKKRGRRERAKRSNMRRWRSSPAPAPRTADYTRACGLMVAVADRSGAYRDRMGQLQGSDRVLGVPNHANSLPDPRLRVTTHDKTYPQRPPLSFVFSTTVAIFN
jgi:hypothetical protein